MGVPCAAYERIKKAYSWDLITALIGGTQAMRGKKQTFLPKNAQEEIKDYEARLGRSFLYEALGDAIDRLVSKPFSEKVRIENIPPELEELNENIDGEGSNVDDFAEKCFRSGGTWGGYHVLVDFPQTDNTDPNRITKKQEQDLGLRPHFNLIHAPDLIYWKSHKANGRYVLDEIRYWEMVTDYEENEEAQMVRVFRPESWSLYKKNKKTNEYDELVEAGMHNFPGIPLVTTYFRHNSFMEFKPVYLKLAWKNLEHWQSSSDQRNILHYTRLATLFLKGFKEHDLTTFAIGANRALITENNEADAKYVEISGKSTEAGNKDLEDLKREMENLGARPFVVRTNVTATSQVQSEVNAQTDIESYIRSAERGFKQAYKLAGMWMNPSKKYDLPESFNFNIFSDFSIGFYGSQEIDKIRDAYNAGVIDQETYINELKRRSILSENVNVEELMEKAPGNPLFAALGNDVFKEDKDKKKDENEE